MSVGCETDSHAHQQIITYVVVQEITTNMYTSKQLNCFFQVTGEQKLTQVAPHISGRETILQGLVNVSGCVVYFV